MYWSISHCNTVSKQRKCLICACLIEIPLVLSICHFSRVIPAIKPYQPTLDCVLTALYNVHPSRNLFFDEKDSSNALPRVLHQKYSLIGLIEYCILQTLASSGSLRTAASCAHKLSEESSAINSGRKFCLTSEVRTDTWRSHTNTDGVTQQVSRTTN